MRSLRARRKPVRYSQDGVEDDDDDRSAVSLEESSTKDEEGDEDDADVDNDSTASEESEEECKPVAKQKSTATMGTAAPQVKQDTSDEEDAKPSATATVKVEDGVPESETSKHGNKPQLVATARSAKTTRKVSTGPSRRKEKPKCPHCNKAFSMASRLSYHLKNLVCRPELKKGMASEAADQDATDAAMADVGSDATSHAKQDNTVQVDEEGNPFCPHCMITFATMEEAQDHVQSYVCRPEAEQKEKTTATPNTKKATRKRKGSKSSSGSNKKARGPVEERTCPTCKRVFSSIPGLTYHVRNKVCLTVRRKNTIAFPSLDKGIRFDTTFGIVSVIKDDRATSAVELPANLPSEMKKYSSSTTKREMQVQKHYSNVATASLVRRKLLSRLYENNDVSQQTVFDAYFGVDPRSMTKFRKTAPYPPMIANPSMPDGSFPDRMVECIMVPDQRPRFIGLDSPNALEGLADEASNVRPTKVFIQRRLLTQTYVEDAIRFVCGTCCQCFLSKSGFQHHEFNGNCARKIEAAKEKKVQNMTAREIRAAVAVQRHDNRDNTDVPLAVDPIVTKTTNIVNEKTGKKLKLKKIKREEKELVSPLQVIAQLKSELQSVQGSMIGPVYPTVWKALGYERPKPKYKKKKRKKKKKAAKRKAKQVTGEHLQKKANTAIAPPVQFRSPLHQPPPGSSIIQEWAAKLPVKPVVLLPQAPLIDSRALINEVDSGRYPTFKRFEGKNDTACTLCKREGKPWKLGTRGRNRLFLPCNFCHRSVHFACVLKRYTLKEPEPEDEFMCHFCIATIVARRRRAEKRRLEKLDIEPMGEEEVAAKNMEEVQLVAGSLKGKQNESIAAQVKRTEELSELLHDSKTRLLMAMKIAQSNESLCALVSDFETQSAPFSPAIGTEQAS